MMKRFFARNISIRGRFLRGFAALALLVGGGAGSSHSKG